jgi:hypothetical protein
VLDRSLNRDFHRLPQTLKLDVLRERAPSLE